MPVTVADHLPAVKILREENIFVMTQQRAFHQDIRPLHIAILNLMPTKITTETQILRLLSNTPLQSDVRLLQPQSHVSKNTSSEHLEAFYSTFEEIVRTGEKFDGLIITGAPVEQMDFTEVHYWEELKAIMDWADSHVYSTLHICWAAQAGLYCYYDIPKYPLEKKCFGVFQHRVLAPANALVRGFDETFYVPHSRHTEVRLEDVQAVPDLQVLATSEEAGPYLMASQDGRRVFVTGHSEYDWNTLQLEYERDVERGLHPEVPKHYFPHDDPTQRPIVCWRSHANLLFTNWLNYCVYQETPFDISQIG